MTDMPKVPPPLHEGEPCTLAIIKPDAFSRDLRGRVVQIMLDQGFSLHRTRIVQPSVDSMLDFYGRQHAGRPYFQALVEFMSSGRCMFTILTREGEAMDSWRQLMGAAVKPVVGTIRRSLCLDYPIMENLVHGSDSPEAFEHEEEVLSANDLLMTP